MTIIFDKFDIQIFLKDNSYTTTSFVFPRNLMYIVSIWEKLRRSLLSIEVPSHVSDNASKSTFFDCMKSQNETVLFFIDLQFNDDNDKHL